MGWWGLAEAAEESLLGEESREEEGSEDRECGDMGLPNGDTANISATKKPASKCRQGTANLPLGSPTTTRKTKSGHKTNPFVSNGKGRTTQRKCLCW